MIILVIVIALAAVFEVLSVASIMPFMALLADPSAARTNDVAAGLLASLGATSDASIIGLAGALSLCLLALSNGLAIASNMLIFRFVHMHGHQVSSLLLERYMRQPYRFFLERNVQDLQKNVVSEVRRVTSAVLLPLLQMVSKMMVLALMIILLFVVQPTVSVVSAVVIGGLYALIFWSVRRRLTKAGREIASSEEGRFKAAAEALLGIKEIKVAGTEPEFQRRYGFESNRQARSYITADILTVLPKNVLELIAFGGIVIIAMYLVSTASSGAEVLPVIVLYAFAGYRLLPAVQQIYSSVAVIRFNYPALQIVARDIRLDTSAPRSKTRLPLSFSRDIALDQVSFGYAEKAAVSDVSLQIQRNTTVGFVGKSGAGKSTIIDILLGLLPPSAGQLLVDGKPVAPDQMAEWQSLLGFVPQHIFLTDASIASNIAFGEPADSIDYDRINDVIYLSNLVEYVAELPEGIHTPVGDRGVRLSGGQRQRIGIARALYRRPQILVLDEATSALDNVTERAIVEAIDRMAGQITIVIIAHRLTSLQHADTIFFMENGRLTAQGDYEALYGSHQPFRQMVLSGKDDLYVDGGSNAEG